MLGALKTGIDAATGEAILVAMGDLSDDIAVRPTLFRDWENGTWIACRSRWMPGGAMTRGPFLKTTLSRWAGKSLYPVGALPVRDPTNNFKLYDARFLKSEVIESRRGFEFALEMSYKAHRRGGRRTERPAAGSECAQGQSKFRLIRWLPGYLKWYLLAIRDRFLRRPPASAR